MLTLLRDNSVLYNLARMLSVIARFNFKVKSNHIANQVEVLNVIQYDRFALN